MEGKRHSLKDEEGSMMLVDVPCTQLGNPKSKEGIGQSVKTQEEIDVH